jgi:hypothetical protein
VARDRARIDAVPDLPQGADWRLFPAMITGVTPEIRQQVEQLLRDKLAEFWTSITRRIAGITTLHKMEHTMPMQELLTGAINIVLLAAFVMVLAIFPPEALNTFRIGCFLGVLFLSFLIEFLVRCHRSTPRNGN